MANAKQEQENGILAQVNEADVRLYIKRNARLQRKIDALNRELERVADKELHYLNEIDCLQRGLDLKLQELEKRAESYKAQVIVYKGLMDKILDKLTNSDNEQRY